MKDLLQRVRYRLWQFRQVLWPCYDTGKWAESIAGLSLPVRTQLNKLQDSEKAHVLRVFMAINESRDCDDIRSELLLLALVHDIGKSIIRHSLAYKVLKVFCPRANKRHCIAGALFLRHHSSDRVLIRRVLRHHDRPAVDNVTRTFQTFDDRL